MASKRTVHVHPGEVLGEEFLKPMGLSQYRLAKATGLSATRVGEIVRGTRSITADTALRFAGAFGTTPQFWMNLQSEFDLRLARTRLGRKLAEVEPLSA